MELIKSKNEQTPLVITSLLDNPTSDAHTPPMLCSHCLRSESREAWPYCKGPVPSPSCMLQKTCATTMEHSLNLCRVVQFLLPCCQRTVPCISNFCMKLWNPKKRKWRNSVQFGKVRLLEESNNLGNENLKIQCRKVWKSYQPCLKYIFDIVNAPEVYF